MKKASPICSIDFAQWRAACDVEVTSYADFGLRVAPAKAPLEAVVADAELAKQPRAAWLPPYRLEVAPGIFVTLRDKAIRDPFDGATRVVTVRVSA